MINSFTQSPVVRWVAVALILLVLLAWAYLAWKTQQDLSARVACAPIPIYLSGVRVGWIAWHPPYPCVMY